jgi:Holliday junction DNA helicase RuvA
MGQAILSGVSPAALKSHIATGNTGALTAIPGVGRKIAERLVVELRDKIASLAPDAGLLAGTSGEQSRIRMEALLALVSLGYNRNAAEKAIGLALKESSDHEITVESLVKASLRHASK